jgi:hypothetical protein
MTPTGLIRLKYMKEHGAKSIPSTHYSRWLESELAEKRSNKTRIFRRIIKFNHKTRTRKVVNYWHFLKNDSQKECFQKSLKHRNEMIESINFFVSKSEDYFFDIIQIPIRSYTNSNSKL